MNSPRSILVCFAVKEEAAFFQPASLPGVDAIITGMGQKNAASGIEQALYPARPGLVITAGFAGGLDPALESADVVFDVDAETGLAAKLREAGAVAAVFHCAQRVATTVAEKAELRKTTDADVVEMESGVIRAMCRERGIPSATIRVISDTANEDLPLDFNALMTADDRINYAKLAGAVLLSPGKIPALMRFQKQTTAAAQALARTLHRVLGA